MSFEGFKHIIASLKDIGCNVEAAELEKIDAALRERYSPMDSPLRAPVGPQSPVNVTPQPRVDTKQWEQIGPIRELKYVLQDINNGKTEALQELPDSIEQTKRLIERTRGSNPALVPALEAQVKQGERHLSVKPTPPAGEWYPHMASSIEQLEKLGYPAMAQRLAKVTRALTASVHVDEHRVPSLETVFEGSTEEKEVRKHLEALAKLHDEIGKHVRDFLKEYESRMKHVTSKKDEAKSTKNLVAHVTVSDAKIDSLIKDFKKKLKEHPINK